MFEREYRDLAHVPRWGILPVIRRQSVAEHSYFVTLYMHQICLVLNLGNHILIECLRHGLEHDRSECYTSDIPGPVKRSIVDPDKEKWYELKEDLRRFQTEKYETNVIVVAVRKLADLMDEYAYWHEEMMLGNRRSERMKNVIRPAMEGAAEKLGELTNNEEFVFPLILLPFRESMLSHKITPEDPRDELAS